ncbi:DUF1173 family protein [Methylomicrobium agile]|uniref:DUF1173 family protein n=1 Tax=Methylomicrobium agile TaxID=39774 RepID=UPI0004DF611F|nr:DUF1173 family protein [Methylomicrobium agile]
MSEINIDGTLIDYAQLSDPENHYAQQLMARYYKGLVHPFCTCLADDQCREINIRKRSCYFPARNAKTSGNHAPWCKLYINPALTQYQRDNQPAIIEKDDKLDVKIKAILTISAKPKPKTSKIYGTEATASKTTSRTGITLLGFLHLCWQTANLNDWRPAKQPKCGLNTVASSIHKIAGKITVGRHPLAEKLIIPHWIFPENDTTETRDQHYWNEIRKISMAESQKNLEEKTANSGKAAIVIGLVQRLIKTKGSSGNVGVSIQLLDSLLWMPAELAKKTEHSFGQWLSEIGKPARHIIVICTVFRKGDYYTIGDIALMRTSKQFIPVDSSYELLVADKLVAENRAFTKPLKLDEEPYLPDFVLNDCRQKWVLEVFGLNDAEYLRRKAEKLAYYRKRQIFCWHWSPISNSVMAEFPDQQ